MKMPTPMIVLGTVAAAYIFGGDAMRNMFGKLIHAMQAVIGAFLGGPKQRQAQERDAREREQSENTREGRNPEGVIDERFMERQVEAMLRQQEEARQAKEETVRIDEKKDTIRCFVPDRWMEMTPEGRMDAVTMLVADMKENLGLSGDYFVSFDENSSDAGIYFSEDSEGRKTLTVGCGAYIDGGGPTVPVDVFNKIVKEMAYQRQEEIEVGTVVPTAKEAEIQDLVSYNLKSSTENIDLPKIYFLGSRINAQDNQTGKSFITADENSPAERFGMSILQPSERFPNRTQAMYHERLADMIAECGTMTPELSACLAEYERTSYFNVRDMMGELYGCANIEREIDKAFATNNPDNTRQVGKLNSQVLYAVSLYQVQSYADIHGREFKDPRDKIVESTKGEIDEMSANQYKMNKGRLAHEGISVKEVVADEEWESRHPGKKDRNGGNGKENHGNGKPCKNTPENEEPVNGVPEEKNPEAEPEPETETGNGPGEPEPENPPSAFDYGDLIMDGYYEGDNYNQYDNLEESGFYDFGPETGEGRQYGSNDSTYGCSDFYVDPEIEAMQNEYLSHFVEPEDEEFEINGQDSDEPSI